MGCSYVAPMMWVVIYERGVPGGALSLKSTDYPDQGHHRDRPLWGKIPTAGPGIEPGTSCLVVRSPDHQPTRLFEKEEVDRKFPNNIFYSALKGGMLSGQNFDRFCLRRNWCRFYKRSGWCRFRSERHWKSRSHRNSKSESSSTYVVATPNKPSWPLIIFLLCIFNCNWVDTRWQ
jgi:hypothetical protein